MLTKHDAETGHEFYHATARNRDGTAVRCRANGKCKTWKTRPDDWRLPVKYGFKDCFYLANYNAHEWMTYDPTTRKPTLTELINWYYYGAVLARQTNKGTLIKRVTAALSTITDEPNALTSVVRGLCDLHRGANNGHDWADGDCERFGGILADALQDAGYCDEDLIEMCRAGWLWSIIHRLDEQRPDLESTRNSDSWYAIRDRVNANAQSSNPPNRCPREDQD